jgi:UDP-N-acetylglucosamine 2-epimerase (non-hydrolysing)
MWFKHLVTIDLIGLSHSNVVSQIPKQKVIVVVGTRPEAIKMAPVYRAFVEHPGFTPILVSTGQHTALLRKALDDFGLKPDHELQVMTPAQSLAATAARILERFNPIVTELRPAAVLVQGDTTTAFAAGLAAFYAGIPVAHVEAGLRTYDFANPFPEEANRQLLDRICRWCFAPTLDAREHLLAELIALERIHVTGNTGIDALLWTLQHSNLDSGIEPFVLMTLHRRESFGEPFREILAGVLDFLSAVPDAQLYWPVHPNPVVMAIADEMLANHERVHRIPPQDYKSFARLLATCRIVLTDSGGIQEEAPSLGKRVLVARDTTERTEAVRTGQNRLIGRTRKKVAEELVHAWGEPTYVGPLPAANPYGDGQASRRVVQILANDLFVG